VKANPDTCVGIWKCRVETRTVEKVEANGTLPPEEGNLEKKEVYQCPDDIYILFNPWEQSKHFYYTSRKMPTTAFIEE
jgi:hypothetical protein